MTVPLPDLTAADLGLVGFTLALVLTPGALVGAAGGLRGWSLVAAAPLLTYAMAGLTGPWTTALGIPWSPWVLVSATLVLAAVVAVVRVVVTPGRDPDRAPDRPPPRPPAADLALAAAVAVSALVGAAAVLGGMGGLGTVPQDWDAVFHASGIRWVAETGDAGLFGMSQTNWFVGGTEIFYPNAYHLVGAVVRQVTAQDLPSVLNAQTCLLPGLAALALAAFVRRFGGSTTHAAGAALAVSGLSAFYDMLWRGPLLPYTTGVVLTPVFALLIVEFLDAADRRARTGTGVLLALGTAGLLCLHPSMLFGAVVFALALVVWRWARRPAALRREPLLLVAAGLGGLALSAQQIAGSIYSAASFPPVDWPADLAWTTATVELLSFGHEADTPQLWPTLLLAVGVATYHRLGELRWVGAVAVVLGALFVLAASSDAEWVNAITRPWWNDRWRLAGLFALTACVLIGHGLAQLAALGAALARAAVPRHPVDPAAVGAVAVVALVAGSGLLDLGRSQIRMSNNTGEGPAVSSAEIAAFHALAEIVPPGTRVLNDRNDGSVWMYPLAGLHPVAGHYDATALGDTDVGLLETRFNQYADDRAVRAAVERLDVGFVLVGRGFLRGEQTQRAPGLTDLADRPFLTEVYRNADATAYRIDRDYVPDRP
ncbi:DUF6541 family protein [Pseudonocardia humida]|uniref:4-amino-4-deoxy-L-arabinose transferase-like glycosyltransferase n=1 Tax=Pseudonocardia humida TaxID=2800819 RepID=A0ABT1A4I4_9PSEU|nr:DUF6541 family protein [Pseudonocardia humida]MCO1657917.1 hypothetical protein [Pseudonocardia humida]